MCDWGLMTFLPSSVHSVDTVLSSVVSCHVSYTTSVQGFMRNQIFATGFSVQVRDKNLVFLLQNSGSINKNKKSRRKKPTEDLSSLGR